MNWLCVDNDNVNHRIGTDVFNRPKCKDNACDSVSLSSTSVGVGNIGQMTCVVPEA